MTSHSLETELPVTPPGSIEHLMKSPLAVFRSDMSVAAAIDEIRKISSDVAFTYGYVLDDGSRLAGVLIMRDLLTVDREIHLADIMEREVFFLLAGTPILDAMKQTMLRHYPEYRELSG